MNKKTEAALVSWMGPCVLVTLGSLTWGCGDDDGNGAPDSSGVAAETQVVALSQADLTKVCEFEQKIHAAHQPTRKEDCTLDAVYNSEDQATCTTKYQECLDEEPEVEAPEDCKTFAFSNLDEACAVTVGELEGCIKADAMANEARYSEATCDEPGVPERAPRSSDLPECEPLVEKCGDLLYQL